MASDASLTPELIQAHSFTSGFRGYDQQEVRSFLNRVAGEIRVLRERTEHLESAWRSAEERAARPPVLDEDTLMAAVGEETASILRSARAAAAEMRTKAAEDAEKILAEAREQAAKAIQEAEERAGRETHAAEEAATRIVTTARAEVAELVDKARVEGDAIRAKAEKDRQLTIEGANSTRDRILEDLARRRRVATVQIEQLRAGRERLIESYAVVRRTLEEAQTELSRADAEARAAADEVGRRLRHERDVELSESSRSAEGSDSSGEPEIAAAEVPAPGEEHGQEVVDLTAPGGPLHQAAAAAGDAAAEATGAAASPDTAGGSKVDELFARIRATRGATATVARPETDLETAVEAEEAEEAGPALEAGAALEAPVTETTGATAATGATEGAHTAARSDQPPDTPAEDELDTRDDTLSEADESLLQQRESVIVDLEVTLTRRLKRALQNEQNDLLDRLRNLREQPTAPLLLPGEEEQVARYSDAARPLLVQAAAAGAQFARRILDITDAASSNGANGSTSDHERGGSANGTGRAGTGKGGKAADWAHHPAIDELAKEAGNNIVGALRRRLEQAIDVTAGDDQAVLIESLGAAYREWKTQRIERLAGDMLSASFSRGTWEASPDGTLLRWIVEDADGPCPDCDDDALAGELPKGEPFPTGQNHPPAHTGCRCLLVPAPPG
jgi:DivIVA domain-containing protein